MLKDEEGNDEVVCPPPICPPSLSPALAGWLNAMVSGHIETLLLAMGKADAFALC